MKKMMEWTAAAKTARGSTLVASGLAAISIVWRPRSGSVQHAVEVDAGVRHRLFFGFRPRNLTIRYMPG